MLTNLSITGMHCQACKKLIESELSDIEGVKTISVDLANASASIEHNDQQINLQTLIDKVIELGYQAQLKN
ncbi:MAG: heavy-metal-associated domain-containing protein [Acidobacteria bacterium]|nr:heavy-metal-associated domain-containing protein [Acidobacteriota bacterium]